MRRFCRSQLGPLGAFALLVVSSYVLFDLLDIDGSNFQRGGDVYVIAEEKVAGDKGVCGDGLAPAWLAPPRTLPLALRWSPNGPPPAPADGRPPCRIVRTRRGTVHQPTRAAQGSDPA